MQGIAFAEHWRAASNIAEGVKLTFNSLTFFAFLGVVLASYWAVSPRLRNAVLLVASYVFYGFWDWRFLSLLALSTVCDFTIARRLSRTESPGARKALLATSIGLNLGVLGIFKYANFFIDGLEELLQTAGLEASTPTLTIILPVGISFYTFQTISYTFDVYRNQITPTNSLLNFATYVAYFPQLVAGPIERAKRLLPRIENTERRFPDAAELDLALSLIMFGLVKKVVIADGVAPIVNQLFDNSNEASTGLAIAGIIGFSLQIYGDFAGYTDIARGVSKLFGIDLVVNFREPYFSRNITEFWRRWHISLSNWLRDYLYISLGGNRRGLKRTYVNLMITMLLGGLWHGASWNFVLWGGLHGFYLAFLRKMNGGKVETSNLIKWSHLPAVVTTFVVVSLTWIPFRSADFGQTKAVVERLVDGGSVGVAPADVVLLFFLGALTFVLDMAQRLQTHRWDQQPRAKHLSRNPLVSGAVVASFIGLLVLFSGGSSEPFIYFQF